MSEAVVSRPPDQPASGGQALPAPSLAGPAQAGVLIATPCMWGLGTGAGSPVQPQMVREFAGTPGVAALVSIAVTVPGLMIGLLSVVAGRLADRVGRVRLLTVALFCYAVFGTAPLWLPTLPLVVASRFGVGVTEAVIMTCSITLLADLWTGAARDRLFGLDTVVSAVASVVLVAVSGVIATGGWRFPFWLYTVGVVLAVLTAWLVRDPGGLRTLAADLPPLNWRPLVAPVVMALLGGIVFFAPIVEMSYKLASIGTTSPAVIGLISAVVAIALSAGAASFSVGRVSRRGPRVLLPVAFGVAGIGLVLLGAGSTVPVVVAGGIVCSIGCGIMRPTLLTWALAPLALDQRGRATGIWTSAATIGQFLCPLLVLVLSGLLGGLTGGLVALGVGSVLLALPARGYAAAG